MLADLAAVCMLLLSIYAHWALSRETISESRALLTRILLASAGTALGVFAVSFAQFADVHDASAVALFLIGFGQVHAPAAVILFLKSERAARAS